MRAISRIPTFILILGAAAVVFLLPRTLSSGPAQRVDVPAPGGVGTSEILAPLYPAPVTRPRTRSASGPVARSATPVGSRFAVAAVHSTTATAHPAAHAATKATKSGARASHAAPHHTAPAPKPAPAPAPTPAPAPPTPTPTPTPDPGPAPPTPAPTPAPPAATDDRSLASDTPAPAPTPAPTASGETCVRFPWGHGRYDRCVPTPATPQVPVPQVTVPQVTVQVSTNDSDDDEQQQQVVPQVTMPQPPQPPQPPSFGWGHHGRR